MEVRRLRPGDSKLGVETIRSLKAPDGYPTPTEAYFETFLSRPENVFIVAIDGTDPVGYISAYLLDRIDRDQRMMFLYEIGVAELHRRRGIGRRMIEALKSECQEVDAMKMWVPTGRSNIAATRLYASTGAVPLPSGDEVTYSYPRESFAGAHPDD
jgi:ribosomal protein S18 acetylase RimI-like enzyme